MAVHAGTFSQVHRAAAVPTGKVKTEAIPLGRYSDMPQYLLLLHDDPASWAKLSAEERKWWMEKYGAYREQLKAKNAWLGGQKLADEPGRVLRGAGDDVRVIDGP